MVHAEGWMMSVGLEGRVVAKARKQAGRPAAQKGPKRQILGIRGSEAYKAWLVRFAEQERSDLADLVDDALVAYAKERGFEAPPKR
jgi:hypothetical protein